MLVPKLTLSDLLAVASAPKFVKAPTAVVAPVPPFATLIVSPIFALVMAPSAILVVLTALSANLPVVTDAFAILLVLMAASEITGAAAVVPTPFKSPPN